MNLPLQNKTAIVTGSSRGIGSFIALELAKSGANVVINYLQNRDQAEKIKEEIQKLGRKTEVIQADVSKSDQVKRMIQTVLERFGGIEILINNAGIIRDKTLKNMSLDSWREVLSVNLEGMFNCIHGVIPAMIEKKYGRIVNIASVIGQTGALGQANYAAAKAGAIGLTKSAALELARFGITVNAVCPGYCNTDMFQVIPPAIRESIIEKIPLKRLAEPEELARCIRFLVSEADYITGQCININGGIYM